MSSVSVRRWRVNSFKAFLKLPDGADTHLAWIRMCFIGFVTLLLFEMYSRCFIQSFFSPTRFVLRPRADDRGMRGYVGESYDTE